MDDGAVQAREPQTSTARGPCILVHKADRRVEIILHLPYWE